MAMTAKPSQMVATDSDVLYIAQDEDGHFHGPLISDCASTDILEVKLKGQPIPSGTLWLINTQTMHLTVSELHYLLVVWNAEEGKVLECVEIGNYNGEWGGG